MSTALVDCSALELRTRLVSGEVSAEDVCEAFLERTEHLDPMLHAFHCLIPELARARAHWLDRHRPDGPLPPLWGIPIGDKDLFDRAGVRTTAGSRAYATRVASSDSPLVRTLDDAGAVSLGKTATPEFGMNGYTENLLFPAPKNPWALNCGPGGSSGGAAVAVAAGMLPLAPGNDGGGSIRIPAAACGLVGLKPGRGVVPDQSGVGVPGGLVTAGPLARTAEDAALLFDAMTPRNRSGQIVHPTATSGTGTPTHGGGAGAATLTTLRAVRQLSDRQLQGLRVRVATDTHWEEAYAITLSPEAKQALSWAADTLSDLGAEVAVGHVPPAPGYPQAFRTVWHSNMAVSAAGVPAAEQELFEPMTRWAIAQGRTHTAVELADALSVFDRLERDAIQMFHDVDVLLTPALALPPRPIGWFKNADPEADFARQCQYEPYTSWVNVAGLPAVTVPAVRVAGVPMGVQLIGNAGSEACLLSLASRLQQINGSGRWRPSLSAAE